MLQQIFMTEIHAKDWSYWISDRNLRYKIDLIQEQEKEVVQEDEEEENEMVPVPNTSKKRSREEEELADLLLGPEYNQAKKAKQR
ncbi:hypothetical protein K458DRAFT_396025 [Lentithecium fluviatile CBS 122367]|uniref:Uncharacterized protein n=1 Tax=Lentithecium fluviatile CBS 122367 TaxID=1168545 RepID=A0A6G1IGR6_9PLEO|nr:hypothetical protein K458DRAFT_396025 [Lentithecium fluviatile CBS 122367]